MYPFIFTYVFLCYRCTNDDKQRIQNSPVDIRISDKIITMYYCVKHIVEYVYLKCDDMC